MIQGQLRMGARATIYAALPTVNNKKCRRFADNKMPSIANRSLMLQLQNRKRPKPQIGAHCGANVDARQYVDTSFEEKDSGNKDASAELFSLSCPTCAGGFSSDSG